MATADDLVRAGEKGRQRRSHGLGARVELGEGQRFPGVGDLQGREIGESRGGAAEDLRQPPHSLLVRNVRGGAGRRRRPSGCTGRCPPARAGSCRPPRGTAATPRTSDPERARRRLPGWGLSSLDLRRRAGLARAARPSSVPDSGAQSKYRSSVPLRRMSRVTQWNPPPSIFECRSLSGMTSRPVLLQEPDQGGLIPIDHDQIGIDAEQVHVDPVAADALGQIVGIVPLRVLHGRAVDDVPLLQDRGQRLVDRPGRDCRARGRAAAPRTSSRCGCRSRRPSGSEPGTSRPGWSAATAPPARFPCRSPDRSGPGRDAGRSPHRTPARGCVAWAWSGRPRTASRAAWAWGRRTISRPTSGSRSAERGS